MGFLNSMLRILRSAQLVCLVALLAGASGCRSTFAFRLDSPAGATLHIPKGPFTPARSLPIPFIATLEPGDGYLYYPVTIVIPKSASAKVGGGGKQIVLHGKLHIYSATPLTEGQTVNLPIPEARVASLVSGQLAEITQFVFDPSDANRHLASIVLRTSPF